MRPDYKDFPLFIRGLQSFLIALWLWCFLPTMGKLNLLQSPDSFIFILLALAVAQFVPNRLFRFFVAFMTSIVYMVYYFRQPGDTIIEGISYIFTSDIREIPDAFHGALPVDPLQTHLFILVLAVLYWLIIYAASRPKTWLLYSVLGIFVLALIDGNTPVHPNQAMIGVLLISILNLGLVQFASLTVHPGFQFVKWQRFFIPFGILVTVIFGVGFVMPKRPAVWANPFLNMGNGSLQGSGSTVHMVGYTLDDSRLGGSFIVDDTPVLSVIADGPSYLRGQSLTDYTGKGWVAAEPGTLQDNYEYEYVGGAFSNPTHFAFSHMPTKPLSQNIQVLSDKLDTHDLLAGWAISKVNSISGMPQNATLSMDLLGGNLNAPELKAGDSYVVSTTELQDPYSVLAASSPTYAQMKQQLVMQESGAGMPVDQGMGYYTQLPPELPTRVHTLAEKVVGNATTEYEMVQRVQDYLKQNYLYTNTGVPVPGKNQDYVDQFLFESKKGYCNNFSSAMAVMLRTLGIPTRFVTGFTDGELDPSYSGTKNRYIIQESDAHSWVEVLFPHYGWIPFDPTPGYSLDFAAAAVTDPGKLTGQQTPSKVTKVPPVLPQTGESGIGEPLAFDWVNFLWWTLRVTGVLIILGLFILWFFKNKMIVKRLAKIWANSHTEIPPRPILHLVRLLQKTGAVSRNEVTVRDLHDAAKKYGIDTKAYTHFVRTVENSWYGGQVPTAEDAERLQQTWKMWLLSVLKLHKRK